jgi:hypothetical protein
MILMIFAAAAFSQTTLPAGRIAVSSISGAQLERECRESARQDMDFCSGYILGTADALQISHLTCRPHSDVATLQTVAVVRRYILDHPEQWHEHAATIVYAALVRAFPCPTDSR